MPTPSFDDLLRGPCEPCRAGTPPLDGASAAERAAALGHGWKLEGGHLVRELGFADFRRALDYVVAIGAMSDEVGHHPDVQLGWGRVRLEIWTHSAGGLTPTDFAWAARAEALNRRPFPDT